jgi:hypothetical protein
LPTLNKTRFKTHEMIMENPADDLEREYVQAELRQQADALEEKLSRNPKTYRALLEELARREIAKSPKQNNAGNISTDDSNADQLL